MTTDFGKKQQSIMAPNNKPFDAVQMMRSIRDQFDKQIKDMTFEQEQAWIRKHLNDESMKITDDNMDGTKPG